MRPAPVSLQNMWRVPAVFLGVKISIPRGQRSRPAGSENEPWGGGRNRKLAVDGVQTSTTERVGVPRQRRLRSNARGEPGPGILPIDAYRPKPEPARESRTRRLPVQAATHQRHSRIRGSPCGDPAASRPAFHSPSRHFGAQGRATEDASRYCRWPLPLSPRIRSILISIAQSQSGAEPTQRSHFWRSASGYATP